MNPFPDSTKASELLQSVREVLPRIGLVPGNAALESWRSALDGLSNEELLGAEIHDDDMACCVRSGILLRGDLLDASHELSQGIHSRDGSYWHGIMHRREPDFSNSGYWFRKVGHHIVFDELTVRAAGPADSETLKELTGDGGWDPFRFISLCESCHQGERPELHDQLLALQELEIELLLSHCYRRAVGS